MKKLAERINRKRFFLNIVLPTLLTIGLFIVLIFRFIIPYFEQNMLNGKKEMIRELVNVAISIASQYEEEAAAGRLTLPEAQEKAIAGIRHLRYGIGNKDYCWITDLLPRMIMHPYRSDLDGEDLSGFRDPSGKKLFVEMVRTVQAAGNGYVNYMWQWMDDSTRIVPKISYVKAFRPWGWIIGTGVYIEDVRREIAAIKRRLVIISLVISALMALLLTFIVRQNLGVERKRTEAERELKESREKYKALVEASTEGTWMILEGKGIYANKKLQELLDWNDADRFNGDFHELLAFGRREDSLKIAGFLAGESTYLQLETEVATRSGTTAPVLLSVSKITLSDKKGLIVIVKELARERENTPEPGADDIPFLHVADLLGLGYFQATPGRKGKIIRANRAAAAMLGFASGEDVLKMTVSELIAEREEWAGLVKRLSRQDAVKGYAVQIRTKTGARRTLSVSARVNRDGNGDILNTEGLLEDVTERKNKEILKTGVLNEVQALLLFLNQRVRNLAGDFTAGDMQMPVKEAAALMTGHQTDALLVRSQAGDPVGILTDRDFRERVAAGGADGRRPVSEFMSSPLVSIGEDETLAEALILMRQKNIGHLAVRNGENRISGILDAREIEYRQFVCQEMLMGRIGKAVTATDLRAVFQRLPLLVNALVAGGARAAIVTRLITAVADGITEKLAGLVTAELGPAPSAFAFITLGSEGRSEQTLLTDQDNALIYADMPEKESEAARNYFVRFGKRMNVLLSQAGYELCKGDVMAGNPSWNLSLAEWKGNFTKWIVTPDPQNLLELSTFFDLRRVVGDQALVDDLSRHIRRTLRENPAFFSHLARVCMNYKIPLGIFGKIHTESTEEHSNSVNIKNAIRVIVNLVRLYAMSGGIGETNSLERMNRVWEKGPFSDSFYHDLVYSFDFLMTLQFRSQVKAYLENRRMDHYVDLSDLAGIEVTPLKAIFSQIAVFQTKLKHDFAVPE